MDKKTKNKIAILGATSHIAKGLIYHFSREGYKNIYLFARSKNKLEAFLKQINCPYAYPKKDFADLSKHGYDAIINCVGLGTPVKVKETDGNIFKLTEEFDNMVLEYLRRYPRAVYINFSSGAVYSISVNDMKPENYYGIAKLHQEAKHRALNKSSIIDIRLFSYFSRFIDLDSGYFLTELLKSLKNKNIFIAEPCDFTRDFISPRDLFNLICLIIKAKPFNSAIDAYSLAAVSKIKLLKYFAKTHGLKYTFKHNLNLICPTGVKSLYCPKSRKAAGLGYKPNDSSIETVAMESKYILEK
ncbi:MAG: NAD(P)-dependent oxidoreductase [Candidatus Omnitrophota bacterium]